MIVDQYTCLILRITFCPWQICSSVNVSSNSFFSSIKSISRLRMNVIFFYWQAEVLSVNFTQDEPGELIGGSRFKPVDQFLLPKVEHAMHFYKSLCI